MQTDGTQVSVIVPMFNEEATVGNVLARLTIVLQKTGLKHEIIVVDDFSVDGSVEVAKKHKVSVYELPRHMGKGFAVRSGFSKAKGNIIVTIDSDGSHRPEELPLLLRAATQGEADLVIGSRFLPSTSVTRRRGQVGNRKAGNRFFNILIDLLTQKSLSDSQSGYRVMTAQVLDSVNLKSDTYEIESEMLVKTLRRGFRVLEVPISFEQRTHGTTGIDPIRDGMKILFSILCAYLRS